MCRFPGCTSTKVEVHHRRHWFHGGETSPGNLVSYCR
ncbi:MAG: HNH endonuclease [Actinobacteria bacterium ATB1]|nr:HNH endonuclease [Actinobacteria bacterium ATB1]